MTIITDDPDWARDMYEARALAMLFVEKHGRAPLDGTPCTVAAGNGLTVSCHSLRSLVQLTIDVRGNAADRSERVLSVEWQHGDAWRVAIQTFHRGRWQSRLKAMVHPRPWLERWRAVALFTAQPDRRSPRSASVIGKIPSTPAKGVGAML
jgi:hypothetical protein